MNQVTNIGTTDFVGITDNQEYQLETIRSCYYLLKAGKTYEALDVINDFFTQKDRDMVQKLAIENEILKNRLRGYGP